MRVTTTDLVGPPVLMILGLARDTDEWHIEVYDDREALIVEGVVLPDTDHHSLIVEPYDYTSHAVAGDPVSVDWDAVGLVHVP